MKYRKAYEWGKTRLDIAGIKENALDARLLLEFVCHTGAGDLYAHSERELTDDEQQRYENLIMLRAERKPLQHLTGYTEFMGLRFFVNSDVLIPRQDTEILVEEAMIDVSDGDRVLDMCTGSGCVLLSLMRYKNDIKGVGADISTEALKVAGKNYESLNGEISGSAKFVESDMFEKVEGTFEVILANPPYIRTADIEGLEDEVRCHDPAIALDGGEDGLDFYRIIAEKAGAHLEPEGRLIMEIGFDQAQAVSGLLDENGFTDIRIIKDLAGLDRVVYARREQ